MLNVPQEIKDLLHTDSVKKNLRIHFPNGERTDICNDLIVMNSVSFKESLCSQNSFKFGLAESPIFECEVVGVSNIKGVTIEVSCEIYCPQTVDGAVWRVDIQQWVYSICYGRFTVKSAERQANYIVRKIIAYNEVATENYNLDEWETWKSLIGFSSEVAYTPQLLNLFFAQIAKIKLYGQSFVSTNLRKSTETRITPYYSGLYRYNICQWNMELYYDEYYFDTEYYNSEENPAEIVFVNPNNNYLQDYFKCLREGITVEGGFIAIYPYPKDFVISTLRVFPLSTGNTYDLVKSKKLKDISIYPYLNNFYDSNMIIVSVLTKIKININYGAEIKTINICDSTNGTGYSFDTEEQALLQTCKIKSSKSLNSKYYVDFSDFDFLKYMSAFLEINGAFGNYGRDNNFNIINIKQSFMMTPASDLYPSGSLTPQGVTGGSILPEDYQSCLYEDEYKQKYGKISVRYKYLENDQEKQGLYEVYINGFDSLSEPSNYDTYLLDNIILQNNYYNAAQISNICTTIASHLDGMTYMPFKLLGRGLPYVEPGDTFEVLTTSGDSITTIVLSRTLKGEMVLTDEYVSVT